LQQPSTAALLGSLDDGGQMRPSALAAALHLDLSSVSRQVAALEREGWVAREPDPSDSRAALLELTPLGREALRRVRARRVDHLRDRLPGWSDDELNSFAAALHRFRTDLIAHPTTRTPDRTPALAGQESR
jgi:DNA-binding MarR family transcriptional regulator